MTPHRHTGLLGDTKSASFWPLLLVSAVLHAGLFWGFSSLNLGGSNRILSEPVTMVELTGPGLKMPGAPPPPAEHPKESAETARLPPPRERTPSNAKVVKQIPSSPAPARALPKQEPVPKPKPPSGAEAVKIPLKSPPKASSRPVPAPTPPPPAPREVESPEDHVADRIAKLREKRASSPEDLIADRIANIRKKQNDSTGDADVAARIAKIREKQIQGSDSQVARRIEALREKYGTHEPGKGSGRADPSAGSSPLAVQGSAGQGALGLIEANYLRGVKDHIDAHWSVPETLKGKGYRAAVTVFVNRNGAVTDWALQGSGNPFFDERVKRAVTEANPFPAVPPGLPGQRFEYELRFSAP